MNENIITVTGNLVADPELRTTRSGAPMLTFRVASTHRYFDNRSGQWEDGVTNYYDCVAFRQLAVHGAKSLTKGDAVLLQGQFRQRRFTRQDGSQGTGCEIQLRSIGPDLAHGVAQWMRAPRARTNGAENGSAENRAPENAGDDLTSWNPVTGEVERRGELPDPATAEFASRRDDGPTEQHGPAGFESSPRTDERLGSGDFADELEDAADDGELDGDLDDDTMGEEAMSEELEGSLT
ncbi:MAG: single-stranded DNA-binding protein [Actinomycetia bacterium]|nr:single-stranded DNA-binding protein [Actinomycetes bacterium]